MPRFQKFKYDEWSEAAREHAETMRPTTIAVDTETSGFGFYEEAFCVTVSWRDYDGSIASYYIDLESDTSGLGHVAVLELLENTTEWVFHNAKFDLQKLELADCLPAGWRNRTTIQDTATLYSLIDENDRKGLKYLAFKILGESTDEEKRLAKVRREMKLKKDDGYHLLPREVIAPYAMKDTEYTLRLWEALWPRLPEDQHDIYAREMEAQLAMLEIESRGFAVDVPYLEKAKSEYGVRLMKLDAKLQTLAARENDATFNPNSVPQITEVLQARGIDVPDTQAATLRPLGDEFADTLLEYKSVKKVHGTYLVPLLNEQQDGIFHPNFNLTTPRTGRMSSGGATNN